jgi:2-oxo-4-hydroxy-4-carboxy--5-ureidoimidazoline (OHCU) decarboxylase
MFGFKNKLKARVEKLEDELERFHQRITIANAQIDDVDKRARENYESAMAVSKKYPYRFEYPYIGTSHEQTRDKLRGEGYELAHVGQSKETWIKRDRT